MFIFSIEQFCRINYSSNFTNFRKQCQVFSENIVVKICS
nr:MAG TPA: hypothetical protein [Caudoviricetes sp.]